MPLRWTEAKAELDALNSTNSQNNALFSNNYLGVGAD